MFSIVPLPCGSIGTRAHAEDQTYESRREARGAVVGGRGMVKTKVQSTSYRRWYSRDPYAAADRTHKTQAQPAAKAEIDSHKMECR